MSTRRSPPRAPVLPATLPVLPLKDAVAYPDTLTPLAIGQERSVRLIDDVLAGGPHARPGRLARPRARRAGPERPPRRRRPRRRRPDAEDPRRDDAGPRPGDRAGPDRALRLRAALPGRDGRRACRTCSSPRPSSRRSPATSSARSREIIEQIPYLPEELQLAVMNVDDPSALAHLIAGALRISTEEKQELLEEVDVGRRLRRLSEILARELEVISLGTQIQSQVESEMQKGQREYYLREQLKAIQRELGEEDETQAEVNELRERIEAAGLPEQALKAAERELSGSSGCRRRPPSTGSSAPTSSGWSICPGRRRPTTTSTSATPARSSTPTTTTSRRSRTASSSTWPSAPSTRSRTGRSSASPARPASARPASASRSRERSGASSSGSRSAACATRRRSAATAAPTSARCRGRSSARCATPARATPCS